jgi:hypothetical protein
MKKCLLTFVVFVLIHSIGFSQTKSINIDSDVNKVNHTSICTDFQVPHCIESCIATIISDTLQINFHKETASTYDDIVISIWHNKFISAYKTVYMVLDSGFNKWIPLKEELSLNTSKWTEATILKGVLLLEFQEIYIDKSGLETKTKKINFSGQFNTKILK